MKNLSKLYDILFFVLTFLLISDLNGSISAMLNTKGVLSELILFITIILLLKSVQITIQIPFLSRYYILFYLFFLIYGTLIYYLLGTEWGSPIERIRSLTPSILLIYTFSKLFMYYSFRNKFNKIINILTVALLVNSIAIIYSFISGNIFIIDDSSERSTGLIASANQAGSVAAIAQVFMIFNAVKLNVNRYMRFIYLGLYVITLFAAVITFSKAAMFKSLIVFLLFIYYFAIKSSRIRAIQNQLNFTKKKVLFPLLLFLAMGVFGFGDKFISSISSYQYSRILSFQQFLQGNINDKTTTNRTSLASYAMQQIEEDYFMGKGLDTFHRMEGNGLGPHNQFLLVLGEIGVIGLLLYLWYWLRLLIKNNNNTPYLSFLGVSTIFILLITAASSHTMLFIKTYVIMFSFLSVLPEVEKSPVISRDA